MNVFSHVAYVWHLRGLFVLLQYVAIMCFLLHDVDDATEETITFLLFR